MTDGRADRPSLGRAAFWVTVLLGGAIFWMAPRPGMGDLSEHAAQIGMLHDLVAGTSRWADLVRINYFTPYLVGYGLALPLSFIMPVVAAMKLLLTLAYYGYVWGCVRLRRTFHDDEGLDWLFVPGFFGFAFQYGFFTFLVAVPLGLLFLVAARGFAKSPTRAGGARLLAAGVLLFFCHGLVFLFACALGVGFVLAERRGLRRLPRELAPYVGLAAVALLYFASVRHGEHIMSLPENRPSIDWEWTQPWGWHRAFNFPVFVFASWPSKERALTLLALVFLAAPWVMRWRVNRGEPAAFVPIVAVVAIWFFVPVYFLRTQYLYTRFAVFLLPAYAVLFRPPRSDEAAAWGGIRPAWVSAGLALLSFAFLADMAVRQRRFAAESAPFETVLAAAEPGQRALGLIYAPASAVIRNPFTFHAHAVWYQVEKGGFVDFNFAYFLPQIVRFRADRFPPVPPGFDETPALFDWHALGARVYRYFFVRHAGPLPAHLFDNDECRVVLRAEAGEWSLYERAECR